MWGGKEEGRRDGDKGVGKRGGGVKCGEERRRERLKKMECVCEWERGEKGYKKRECVRGGWKRGFS